LWCGDGRLRHRRAVAYYTDLRDVEVMTAGLRAARAIGQAAALDPWPAKRFCPVPGA
jgi:hypothetical protein